jgi:hypothetical protein
MVDTAIQGNVDCEDYFSHLIVLSLSCVTALVRLCTFTA